MKKLVGIGASPGIAIGRAYVVSSEGFRIFPRPISEGEIEPEVERFKKAIAEVKKDILSIKERFRAEVNEPGLTDILDTHIHLLEDVLLTGETIKRVREEKKNVEYVFSETVEALEKKFSVIDDEYFRQRVQDIQAVSGRVLRKLLGKEKKTLSRLSEKAVVIAHDLTPADTASMDRQNVLAFATEVGGRTAHASIMAKALEIPATVAVQGLMEHVRNDDIVIIDGLKGAVIVDPDEQTLNEYQIRRERFLESERELARLRDLPAQTLDGHTVVLYANIDLPDEVESAVGHGAQGVGLFRTEFLYLNRSTPPGEDEQAEAYSRVAKLLSPAPVTIRTLDIGGDKLLGEQPRYKEANPFMGARAIRFCLEHPAIFKPQLRAILRASASGKVRILFPMITGVTELRRTKAIFEEAKEELRRDGVAFDPDVPVGIMIETPSAAVIADLLAREVDFFSIGTNDLIQYSLVVDRVNERIAHLYEPTHPAILRLLKQIVDASKTAGIELSICGEVAGDLPLVLVLIGFGMEHFSMAPTAIPEVKKLVRSISLKDVRRLAARLLEVPTAEEVRNEIQQAMNQLVSNFNDYELFSWSHTREIA